MRAALCLAGMLLLASPAALPAQQAGAAAPAGGAQAGGVELLLEARTEAFARARPAPAGLDRAVGEALEATRGILLARLAALGARDATVVRQGANRLLVRAPGIGDPAPVRALLGRTGRLELRLVDHDATQEQLAAGQAPPGTEILSYGDYGEEFRIAVRRRAVLTGERIADARQSFDSGTGVPVVTVTFDREGSRLFARATADNVNRQLAILVDEIVVSTPNISEPILGGIAQIAGNFTVEDASELAITLRSGALPIDLAVIEERALPPR